MSIDLRIDELVLEGVAEHEAPLVVEALRAELARLLTSEGEPSRELLGQVAGRRPGVLAAAHTAQGAAALGVMAAGEVHARSWDGQPGTVTASAEPERQRAGGGS